MKTKEFFSTARIPKIVIIIGIPIIILFGTLIFLGNHMNMHDPYSHEEIKNILDPPLDTTKPLNQALFDKYYFTPSIYDEAIVLRKEILEDMEFETFGDQQLFIFTLGDDAKMKKFEQPIFLVENKDEPAFVNAVSRQDTLLFRKTGKIAWTFYAIK